MSRKIHDSISVTFQMPVGAIFTLPPASAQAPTLEEQLSVQYKLVKMGSDMSGYSVVDKGTLLAVQKGGILGVHPDQSVLSTKYETERCTLRTTFCQKALVSA